MSTWCRSAPIGLLVCGLACCFLLAPAAEDVEVPEDTRWGLLEVDGVRLGVTVESTELVVGEPLIATLYLQNRADEARIVPALDEGNAVLFLDDVRVQVDPDRRPAQVELAPGETHEFGFNLPTDEQEPRTIVVRGALRGIEDGQEIAYLRAGKIEVELVE